MVWIVGLTGGIGSGKSAVAERLAALGAAIVDTDQIAHALTAPGGAALPALRETFGTAILTDEHHLDRAALRQIVFAEPAARGRLEAILHPLIRTEVEAQLGRLASADICYGVLVVPLLVETGAYRDRIQRTLVVDCPPELQISRVMARSGLTRQEVEAILAAQATREQRLAHADDVVINAGEWAALAGQIAVLHEKYCTLAARQHA